MKGVNLDTLPSEDCLRKRKSPPKGDEGSLWTTPLWIE